MPRLATLPCGMLRNRLRCAPLRAGLTTKGSLTLSYNDAAHVHAATGAGSNSYAYDQDGNMTQRVVGGQTYTLGYDAEGRMVSVSGPSLTASFVYDGDGARVKHRGLVPPIRPMLAGSSLGQSTTLSETMTFVGGYYEVSGSTVTKYYFAGTNRIAMRTNGTLKYLLSDHLGSTSLATDAAGNKITETRYKAFGEVRYASANSTLPTRYTFTGQYSYVNDDATDLGSSAFGLIYFGARYYDPALGRFSSADMVVPGGPQGYDHYAYGNNSPVVYNDPSGNTPVCVMADENNHCTQWAGTEDAAVAISSGTIYTSVSVTTQSQAEAQNLGSKAENSYTGAGGTAETIIPANSPAYAVTVTATGANIAEDFQSDVDWYSISAEVDWYQTDTGLMIDELTIKNYSPTFVQVPQVELSNFIGKTRVLGPQTAVGTNGDAPGQITMQLNTNLPVYASNTIQVRLISYGGWPPNRTITVTIMAGTVPPAGCSVFLPAP